MDLKVEAARAALQEVRSGMRLGLGTGTTAAEFVKVLGEAVRSQRIESLRCASTSDATTELARTFGIVVEPIANVAPLDLAVDGADEIDGKLRLIKGRGGALLREKIVEQQARRFIVIADESKVVERLGRGTLPVEVTPFACDLLHRRFDEMSLRPELRLRDGAPLVTDEKNRIIDVRVPEPRDIADLVAEIGELAGVVETGFFPREATEALIAGGGRIRRMLSGR